MAEVKDAAVHFEAVKTSMSQSKQGTILRLALHPNEVPPVFILTGLAHDTWLLWLS